MTFNEVGKELPGVWNSSTDGESVLKEGDSIEGIYKKKKDKVGPNKSAMYYIEVEGVNKAVWGSTVLDDKMDFVSVGDKIRITYKGKEKKYHKYIVELDSDEEETQE